MKTLWIPVLLFSLAGGLSTGEETITYEPEEGTTLTRTFEALADYSLHSVEMNGQEVELPEEFSLEVESLERIVVTDEILEVEDGRPTDLRRTFDELLQEATRTEGENEEETTSISDLEGSTVRFLWDDEDEEYYVEVEDDDEDFDEDVLDWLMEDLDFRAILPDYEVEEGDSWEIDPEVYLVLMWPSGLLDFYDEGESGADPFSRTLNEQSIENIEGEGEATFEEISEKDGVRVAVLKIELTVSTGGEGTTDQDETEIDVAITMDREIEGEVLWDLENGHVYAARFEADTELTRTMSGTIENEQGEFELEQAMTFWGTIDYTVEIERE